MEASAEILHHIPVACYRLDENGIINYVNRYAELLFNQKKEALLGCNFWDAFPELKATDFFNAKTALTAQKPLVHDFISTVTQGWIRLTATPADSGVILSFYEIDKLKNAEGNIAGQGPVVSGMDVQETLYENEERFRTVANLVPDLLWSSRAEGSTFWFNDQWLEYTGQTLDEASDYGWLDAIHPDDKNLSLHNFQSAINEKRSFRQEHRIRSATGTYRWFLVQVAPFCNEQGDVLQWYGAATDIEDQKTGQQQLKEFNKQLEQQVAERTEELKENAELLKATLDSSLDMIQVFKAIRNEKGQITDFVWALNNKSAENIYGDVIGKSLLKNNPGVMKAGIFENFIRVTETGLPLQYEKHYPYEQFNGWFHQSVVKMDDGIATSTADITHRKVAEEERFKSYLLLQQSEEAATMGSWEYNLQTGTFIWSAGMYRLFDIEQGTAVRPEIYLQYATEESREAAERLVSDIKTGSKPIDETLKFQIKGKAKVYKIKARLMTDAQGLPEKVLGVDIDITASWLVEEKIRGMEAEQKLELLRATLNTQEEERQRISESLHNGLGQILYGVKLSMDQINLKNIDGQEKKHAGPAANRKASERLHQGKQTYISRTGTHYSGRFWLERSGHGCLSPVERPGNF